MLCFAMSTLRRTASFAAAGTHLHAGGRRVAALPQRTLRTQLMPLSGGMGCPLAPGAFVPSFGSAELHWRGHRKALHQSASPRGVVYRLVLSSAAENDDVNGVAGAIHEAFLNACLPQSGVPYVAALRSFIASTVRAYRLGYSLDALEIELRRVGAESLRSGNRSASGELPRPLEADEVELRTIWLTLVFKVLRYVNFPRDRMPPEAPSEQSSRNRAITEEFRVPDQFDRFVQSIVDAARAGYDLARIRLEQQLQLKSMPQAPGTSIGTSTSQRSPLESAILNQSTRLVLLTVEIVDTWQRNGGIEPLA
ncbi:hypothetical protein CYME_CMT178C [Cyanidioschyzon merolae strain 10D]|uniref:Uncharacterized protein n=1 Tax=Cyanidioschyzon merolae (strain NIES-3377 / 10D) TaxID=280699 RepID=M1VI40_CYAM1|nr:hypothetical protein CYME_CMT178C [Cyanidioschyzon merolae strain 10D]BAM83172.1 hypothetical protein CYME_CMT178C [Cyanidioschyzon merolae strain 10D]|eukprot:XP_005539208.1 hypothetical protein CYME_CMT178C [Cyanidioschyzon merolae strain 10D]